MVGNTSERLLFVECNGATGRPSRIVRPLLSRHVRGNYVTSDSYHSGEIIFEDEKPTVKNRTAIKAAHSTRTAYRKGKPPKTPGDRHIVNEQYLPTDKLLIYQTGPAEAYVPSIHTLTGSYQKRQEEIAKWWFYSSDEIAPPFQVAKYHWATAPWDLARLSNFFLECVKLYAYWKQAQLTGNTDRYVAQQLLVIQGIKEKLVEHGEHLESEPFALVAIGNLAYLALLDGDLKTCGTHLNALKAFNHAKHFECSKQGWLYLAWVDFRYSLIRGTPPILDYFIPSTYRQTLPHLNSEEESKMLKHALRNSALAPCSALFDEVEMHCVFLKLHQLGYALSTSQDSQIALFRLLYDLEYRLRVTHASLRQFERNATITTHEEAIRLNKYAEIVLIAIQLHVWVVSRHLAPVSSYSRKAAIDRACQLICEAPALDLVTTWKCVGDVRSLIWCLVTVAAFALDGSVNRVVPLIKTLQYTLGSFGISTREELSELLQEWFWYEDWHPSKIELVWRAIEEHDIEELCAGFDRLQKRKRCFYVGVVEFYNA